MSPSESKAASVQTNFQTLSTVASSLNSASDELTRVIGTLDEALKKLNLGLTVWVIFEDRSDEHDPSHYDADQIGYCKVNGKWGISLRHIWGNEVFDDHKEDGPWPFTEAPRELRIRSVDKIADLIEALNKEASATTKKIQEKTKEVGELALAIGKIANETKPSNLTERVAAGQKSLTGKLNQMADPGKLTEALGPLPKTGVDVGSLISPISNSLPKGQK